MREEIGKRVKILRRERNLSRAQLGAMIGVSGQYIGKIERGEHRLPVEKIAEICKATGVSTDYLIFGFTDITAAVAELSELSPVQINTGFDILKRLAQIVNAEDGNEMLLREIMRRQYEKSV